MVVSVYQNMTEVVLSPYGGHQLSINLSVIRNCVQIENSVTRNCDECKSDLEFTLGLIHPSMSTKGAVKDASPTTA